MMNFFRGRERGIAFILFAAITALFIWVYALAPFSELANAIIVNCMTALTALIAAALLTRILFYFQSDEPPFFVWTAFAVCLWLWTIAEGTWGFLYTTVGEVPIFSFADLLWLVGYVALTVSLVHQYRLVFPGQTYTIRWAATGVWMAIIAVIETILIATHSTAPFEDFFRYFYTFADTAVGLSALFLVYTFRGRALAMPWLTISSFVVTDIIYIRLTNTGAYDWVMSGISVALIADTLYLIAYLIVAWGLLGQYLLLKNSANPS
ncbi:MAG: hypothetical protein IPP66_22555 [Anaerolineales bacterium]|nr:hypothetical protein [Anaerolineales bacterium]